MQKIIDNKKKLQGEKNTQCKRVIYETKAPPPCSACEYHWRDLKDYHEMKQCGFSADFQYKGHLTENHARSTVIHSLTAKKLFDFE